MIGPFCIAIAYKEKLSFFDFERWGFVDDLALEFGSGWNCEFLKVGVEQLGMGTFALYCHFYFVSVLKNDFFFVYFA